MIGNPTSKRAPREREPRATILLVEPLLLVRQCLRGALEKQGYRVVGEAVSLTEAGPKVAGLRPSLVLAHTDVDALGHLSSNPHLTEALSAAPLIVLSALDDPETIASALRRGATAVVSLNSDMGTVRETIEAVLRERPVAKLSGAVAEPPQLTDLSHLTVREREIAILIARGYSNKEIAHRLQVAPVTVRNQVSRIMQRTGAHSRAEIAAAVALAGWI